MGLGFGLGRRTEGLNWRRRKERVAGGRSTRLVFRFPMANEKRKIFHISFDIFHTQILHLSLKNKRRVPCLLAPASWLLPVPPVFLRSMQSHTKLIIDCYRLCP